MNENLPAKQWTNGSPVILNVQLQIGLWRITLHWELRPHVPGHGSMHLFLIHARFESHSEFITHSGLQFGGVPINSDKQEQTAWSLMFWHLLFGPQTGVLQGSCSLSVAKNNELLFNNLIYINCKDIL